MKVRSTGAMNLLAITAALTLANTIALAWFLFAYMPARAEADVRMANLLHIVHKEWKKQNTRIVPEAKGGK